jgi:hypothetical protein
MKYLPRRILHVDCVRHQASRPAWSGVGEITNTVCVLTLECGCKIQRTPSQVKRLKGRARCEWCESREKQIA